MTNNQLTFATQETIVQPVGGLVVEPPQEQDHVLGANGAEARRSAVERGILMTRNAPHLVKAMPQLVPLLPSMNLAGQALVRTGFVAGDAESYAWAAAAPAGGT